MKNRILLFISAISILLVFSQVCLADQRTYDTSFGVMKLQFNGTYVSGSYTHQNGTLEGTLVDGVMTGVWHQSNGKGSCIFTFNPDLSGFEGKWNYAGDSGLKGDWHGSLKNSGEPAWKGDWRGFPRDADETFRPALFNKSYNTDYGAMTLNFNGSSVTGNYTHQDGKVRGRLEGNVLSGTWTQNNGSGAFMFTFDPSFNSFEGKWNYKGETSMRGGWNGKPK